MAKKYEPIMVRQKPQDPWQFRYAAEDTIVSPVKVFIRSGASFAVPGEETFKEFRELTDAERSLYT